MDHGLRIVLDGVSLRGLRESGARIALGRTVDPRAPAVVWLAFEPAPLTTVGWGAEYGLFAGTGTLRTGAQVPVDAVVTRARRRTRYAFDGRRFVASGDPSIPPDRYDVRNASAAACCFGLVQDARIGTARVRAPLGAVTVPAGTGANFAPAPYLWLWTATGTVSGTVSDPASLANAAPHRVDGSRATFAYDFASGGFSLVTSRGERIEIP
jgi:hypothetical protein